MSQHSPRAVRVRPPEGGGPPADLAAALEEKFAQGTSRSQQQADWARDARQALLGAAPRLQDANADRPGAARAPAPVPRGPAISRPQTAAAPADLTARPPYDFTWPWTGANGNPQQLEAKSDYATGDMSVVAIDDNPQPTHASAWIVEGFFLQPAEAGTLTVWSSPGLSWAWQTYSVMDSAHSDGGIGLFIGLYTLDWRWLGVRQDAPSGNLWSRDMWWGAGSDMGSTSGYPLLAMTEVDVDHIFAVGVKVGVDIAAAGQSGPFYGHADASILVEVPAIGWHLEVAAQL
jgi:hypothetical protein